MGNVHGLMLKLVALSLLLAVAAGGCAAGRDFGEACTTTTDCRMEFVCLQSKCTNPGACAGAGTNCTRTSDCCPAFSCQAGRCEPAMARCGDGRCDAGETQATCCQDCGCATGFTCRRDVGVCVKQVCGNGKCDPGETSANCCRDCGCAAGLVCQANKCTMKPTGSICGNGKCESGENSTTCCTDCGCPAGSACQANVCRAPTGTTLTWTITNNCPDIDDVEFRFFAEERGLAWPGGDLVYTISAGDTVKETLSCISGETVCIGADLPSQGLTWGVDIDNSGFCADCCFVCTSASVNYSFDCP